MQPSAKRQKDSTQKSLNLRSKQQQVSTVALKHIMMLFQLVNQENRMVAVPVVGLSRSKQVQAGPTTISTVNSRGALNRAKAKVSETVTSSE